MILLPLPGLVLCMWGEQFHILRSNSFLALDPKAAYALKKMASKHYISDQEEFDREQAEGRLILIKEGTKVRSVGSSRDTYAIAMTPPRMLFVKVQEGNSREKQGWVLESDVGPAVSCY